MPVVFLLASCSTTTSLKSLPAGQQQVTSVSSDAGEAVRHAINQAVDYCAKKQQRLVARNFSSNYQATQPSEHFQYRASINFICAPDMPSNW